MVGVVGKVGGWLVKWGVGWGAAAGGINGSHLKAFRLALEVRPTWLLLWGGTRCVQQTMRDVSLPQTHAGRGSKLYGSQWCLPPKSPPPVKKKKVGKFHWDAKSWCGV